MADEVEIVESIPSTAVAVLGDVGALTPSQAWAEAWAGDRRHPIAMWLQNQRREATRSAYLQSASAFAVWLGRDPLTATFAELLNYRDYLREQKRAPSSIISHLTRLSAMFSFMAAQGIIPRNPCAGLQLPVKRPARQKGAWEIEHIARFWAAIPDDPSEPPVARLLHLRDAALFRVLLRNGLRVSEAAGANVGNLKRSGPQIVLELVEEDDREHVKGGSSRDAVLKPDTWEHIARYLGARGIDAEAVLAATLGADVMAQPLFRDTRGRAGRPPKGGRASNPDRDTGRLSRFTIGSRIKAYGRAAKLPEWMIHPHACRHTFTTHLIRRGIPVHEVMIATGHKQLATVQGYIDLWQQVQDHAALKLPY